MEVKVWIIIICSLVALCHCAPAQVDDNAARAKRGCSSPTAQPGEVYYEGCTKFECKKIRKTFVWAQRLDSGVCCIVGNKGFPVGSVICNNEELYANLTGEGMFLPAVSEVSDSDVQQQVEGCPSEIPIIENGKIVAGKLYDAYGSDVPEISCRGKSTLWDKDVYHNGPGVLFGSVIINPGCTLVTLIGNEPGQSERFIGPRTIANPKPDIRWSRSDGYLIGTIWPHEPKDGGHIIPAVILMLWTCKQAYPNCIPDDKWQIVTKLDNSAQNMSAQFTYEKTVGTEWSQSMTESRDVSTTVSAEISKAFWGVTAKLGVSKTTGYNWSKVDSTTKSESRTYIVEVTVPPKTTVTIEEVVGFCGGSTIRTDMFRVKDSNNVILRTYQGAVTSYDLTM